MKHDAASWEKLLHVLEWIIDVKLRYSGIDVKLGHADNLDFSLTYISFYDRVTLGNMYGAMMAFQMLVELDNELSRAMRKSDIVARNGTDFWVLIPRNEADLVVPKISRIVEIAAKNGLDVVDYGISTFAFQDNNILKQNSLDSPLIFLEYVKNHCSVARRWSEQAVSDCASPTTRGTGNPTVEIEIKHSTQPN